MEKEVGTASEMVELEASGGFQGFKEAVFNIIGNFFSWLSTHQALGLVLIIVVLGIILWLIMRVRKHRIQVKNEIYTKKKEIGKKDTNIEELEKKVANLQKVLSDQQAVASGAMLKTLSTLTGYDADQLPVFFKSLSRISENSLQIASPQATTDTDSQRLEADNDSPPGIIEPTENLDSDDDSAKKDATEESASGDDSIKEENAEKAEVASDDGSDEAEETKKSGETGLGVGSQ
jgi:multidrug efflux pump subunit AcrB